MTEERWKQIHEVFQAALEQPAAARASYLDEACAGDPGLRREVESLLEAALQTGGFDRLAKRFALGEPEGLPDHIGPYRVEREIGRGGMGIVYLSVRDDDQLSQPVALKVFHAGTHRADLAARFLAERQILAQLDHPHIARLLFGGMTEVGLPYFAMEYVEGQSITDYCDAHHLDIDARLRLFLDICAAVQHAHRHLIVHRDLKPSNILVTEESGSRPDQAQVKLLDFGIAKLIDEAPNVSTVPLTQTGLRLMTPEYASPEQVRSQAVTTATDIYQLGVLLYELLTGRRPYRLPSRLLHEVRRVICEELPEKPSTAVTRVDDQTPSEQAEITGAERVSQERATTVERLRRRLSGDLDTIVLMAMRKEPERRYASAEALADDLRRHLDGLPVRAQPDTLGYRVRKFLRRHPAGMVSAALITVLIVGFGVVMAVQANRIARERDRAQAEARKTEQVAAVLAGLFRASRPEEARGDTLTAFDLLARGVEDLEALSDQPDVQAQMLNTLGWSYLNLGRYEEAERLLMRGLDLRRQLFPDGHVDLATSLRTVATLFLAQGKYDETEPLLREALVIHRTHPEGDSASVAGLLDNLGVLYERRGDYAKAEQFHREELALYSRTIEDADPRITRALNNLAFAMSRQAHYAEAIAIYRDVLNRLRREHDGDHPDVAHTLNNLGTAHRHMEDYAAAEAVYREALDIARRVFGDEHPVVAATLNNLGVVLRRLDRFDEAEVFYREALAMRRRLLGDDHPAVTTTLNNLAVLYRTHGDYDAAEPLMREVVTRQQRALGVHPLTAMSLHNLARLYQQMDRLAEAEQSYRDALSMQQQKLASDHPDISNTQLRLGEVLIEQGRMAEAEVLLLESYRSLEEQFGEEDRRTVLALDRIIALYEAWGKPDEAAKYSAPPPSRP